MGTRRLAIVDDAEIHYAKSADRHIGYQVLRGGRIDLLAFNGGCNIWIDRDDEPHWSRCARIRTGRGDPQD